MIEMTYREALQPEFRQAAGAIWYSDGLDAKTSYSANRIKKALDTVMKDAAKIQEELGLKYAKSTVLPDGKKILHRNPPHGSLSFENDEAKFAFEKEFDQALTEKKLTLEVSKLKFESLSRVQGLTPAAWDFLGAIVEGLPEEAPNA